MDKHATRLSREEKTPEPVFRSVTQAFMTFKIDHDLYCPRCGAVIDFGRGIEWQGPDAFTCGNCNRLIDKNLVLRAMKDLGLI